MRLRFFPKSPNPILLFNISPSKNGDVPVASRRPENDRVACRGPRSSLSIIRRVISFGSVQQYPPALFLPPRPTSVSVHPPSIQQYHPALFLPPRPTSVFTFLLAVHHPPSLPSPPPTFAPRPPTSPTNYTTIPAIQTPPSAS